MCIIPVRTKRSVQADTHYGAVIGHEVDMGTGDEWDNVTVLSGCTLCQTGHQVAGISLDQSLNKKRSLYMFAKLNYAHVSQIKVRLCVSFHFQRPDEPDTFITPYLADHHRPLCPQDPRLIAFTNPGWDSSSEDCLFMNIFAPVVSFTNIT